MSIGDVLLELFGITTRWHLTAVVLLGVLLLPVCLLALADWRMKARR